MRVLIETHGQGQHHDERDLNEVADVDRLLDELAVSNDVILMLGVSEYGDEAELIVGITRAGYVITRLVDGDFQQLVGSPEAVGETEVMLGGQQTPTPNRWLTTRVETARTIGKYVTDSSYPDGQLWEQP